MCGNTSELGDAARSPGKSSLFFLTASPYPGIGLAGDRVAELAKHRMFAVSGALVDCSLKIRGRDLFASLVVLITASGLQGEQPLVDRTM